MAFHTFEAAAIASGKQSLIIGITRRAIGRAVPQLPRSRREVESIVVGASEVRDRDGVISKVELVLRGCAGDSRPGGRIDPVKPKLHTRKESFPPARRFDAQSVKRRQMDSETGTQSGTRLPWTLEPSEVLARKT